MPQIREQIAMVHLPPSKTLKLKTPSKSEPSWFGLDGVFVINSVFMRVCGVSVFKFKLDRKIQKV